MKKIFDIILKPARLILIICAFAYAGLYSLVTFGNFGGGFLDVLASLIIYVLTITAVVAIPLLLLLKKEDAAKLVFIIVGGYWLITEGRSYLSYGQIADSQNGLVVATAVFGFLVGLVLTGVLVLLVLNFILKKELFRFIAVLALVGAYLFIFVFVILELVLFIKYEGAWTNYIQLFLYLVAPVGVLFGYLYFFGTPDYDFPKKAPKEEKPEEPKEEQPSEVEESQE